VKESRKSFKKAIRRAKRESWQQLLAEAASPKQVAVINKIVNKKQGNRLGLLRANEGEPCLNPTNSMDLLVNTHFPGNLPSVPPATGMDPRMCDLKHKEASFITKFKVKEALSSFGDFKSPGLDGIQPCVLKKIDDPTLDRLVSIYKASFLLGHTPQIWLQSKVVFIPKPGKGDYSNPRAFRPITLSSFLIKALERIVLWEINETLLDKPLSSNQHAFRKGRSTESALSHMVEKIEHALLKNKFALGVFLDIQGAFDNVLPSSVVSAMEKKGLNNTIIRWYSHYLCNRTLTFDYEGVHIERALTRGTPQGGVLSPVIWNLVFEGLLDLYEEGFVNVCGFADDAGLITVGTHPHVLMSRMQKATDLALEWGKKAGLKFSPPKTVVVLFTHKRKYNMPPPLIMEGSAIPFSNTVKYLGITLDHKLSWRPHLENKLRASKSHLLNIRNAMGKLWGLPPRMARWVFTGIVRPSLTYGALVWAKVSDCEWAIKALTRLNRLALLGMGHFRHRTPTAGLEVICDVMPLHMHIRCEAASGYVRTLQHKHFRASEMETISRFKKGHRQYSREFLDECGLTESENDSMLEEFSWHKHFSLLKDSFASGKIDYDGKYHIEIFTDGSHLEGNTGSGLFVRLPKTLVKKGDPLDRGFSFHLGRLATVFQGEVHAIKKAADWINKSCRHKSVVIYSDSRAALLALASSRVTSKFTKEAIIALNDASISNEVYLRWIKAHVGIPGNEEADKLAKIGSKGTHLDEDLPLVSHKLVKGLLKARFYEQWNIRWQNSDDCRQTKQWFPSINPNLSHHVVMLDRKHFSLFVQLITGHNFMNRHQALVDKTTDPLCRLCLEDEETSFHIIAECPALAATRRELLGTPFLTNPLVWSVSQVAGFLREASIGSLLDISPAGE
jgi:ribonuclease HI/retron-type reverse transcriptase